MPRRRLTALAAAAALAVLLVAPRPAAAQPAFAWDIADRGSVNALDVTSTFHTEIINTGAVTDTYTVSLVADLPSTWLTTLCDASLCYPPFITTLQYTVAPGDTLYIGVNITPMIETGTGTSTVTVASLGAPGLSRTAVFTVLTAGAQVLVVEAGASGQAQPLVAAVTAGGRAGALWLRQVAGPLSAAELAVFPAVIWDSGDQAVALDAADRDALAAYVAGGGRLLASGADLLGGLVDPAGPFHDPAAASWFAAVLGAAWVGDAGAATEVSGLPGDPIADGLVLRIDGNGANASPDALVAQGGSACLAYAGGQVAGVRRQAAGTRTLCLGFGCAGLDPPADREIFVSAALDWLLGDVASAGVPAASRRLSAAPNPFNPLTGIRVDSQRETVGSLAVFDLRGRRVRALRDGVFGAGPLTVVWDGRDDSGHPLPGGTYVARLVLAGEPTSTLKLTLAK